MKLSNLAKRGRWRSYLEWPLVPVRVVHWWLVAPKVRALGTRLHHRIDALVPQIDALTAQAAGSQDAVKVWQDQANATVASQMGGLRKDSYAIAERIASLEEERSTFTDNAVREASKLWQDQANATMASQMGGLRKDSYAIAQRMASLEQECSTLTDRMTALMREFQSVSDGLDRRHDDSKARPGGESLVIAAGPTGDRFLVRQHDHIGQRIIAGEEWEPHIRAAIEAAADPDAIAIDVGAYIGVHTLTMARCFSNVHAFEPQKGIYQVLCGNLALNDRLNVTTYNTALYDRSVAMRLAPQERQEIKVPLQDGEPSYRKIDNAAALSFEIADAGEKHVDAIALDELDLDNVAVMKIDAQGSDLLVLKGAEATISRSKPVVIFEWERDLAALHDVHFDDVSGFFDRLGYDIVVLQETKPGVQIDYIATPRS